MWRCYLSVDTVPGQHCAYAHHFHRTVDNPILHDHDFYEIFWVEEGHGLHWINQQKRELKPGIVVLIRPEDAHGFTAKQGDCVHIANLQIPPSSWQCLCNRYFPGMQKFFAADSLQEREYYLDAAKMLEIKHAARDLQSGARDMLTTDKFLLNLFGILQSRWLLLEQSVTPDWLLKACDQFRSLKNFEEGTMMFAKLAGRSPAHVARACRKYLKTTPTDIVNEAKMAHAATQLLTTDATIVNIALDSGIQNLGHFYRLFQAKYGFSPSAYRRHQKGAIVASHDRSRIQAESAPELSEPQLGYT